ARGRGHGGELTSPPGFVQDHPEQTGPSLKTSHRAQLDMPVRADAEKSHLVAGSPVESRGACGRKHRSLGILFWQVEGVRERSSGPGVHRPGAGYRSALLEVD